jgi:hypothetical protein
MLPLRITVKKVQQDPAPVLAGLVEESGTQGFGALRRLLADWADDTSRFVGPGERLFVASATAAWWMAVCMGPVSPAITPRAG